MASKKKENKKSRHRRGTTRSARIAALNHARCNRAGSPVPGEPLRAMPTEKSTLEIPPPQPNQEASTASEVVESLRNQILRLLLTKKMKKKGGVEEIIQKIYDDVPFESEFAPPPPAEVWDDDDELETRSPSPSPLDDRITTSFLCAWNGSWTDLPGLDYGSQQHEVDLADTLGLNCAYNNPSYDFIPDGF